MSKEVGIRRRLSVKRRNNLLCRNGHQMRGTEAEILPDLRIADADIRSGRRSHISRGACAPHLDSTDKTIRINMPAGAAVSASDKTAIPFVTLRQPDLHIGTRSFGGHEHQLHNDTRRHFRDLPVPFVNMIRTRNPLYRQYSAILQFQIANRLQIIRSGDRAAKQTAEQGGDQRFHHNQFSCLLWFDKRTLSHKFRFSNITLKIKAGNFPGRFGATGENGKPSAEIFTIFSGKHLIFPENGLLLHP